MTISDDDIREEQRRANDIFEEIEAEIEKEWNGEVPGESAAPGWTKQAEVTNKVLVRAVVLLEGIRDHLLEKGDE